MLNISSNILSERKGLTNYASQKIHVAGFIITKPLQNVIVSQLNQWKLRKQNSTRYRAKTFIGSCIKCTNPTWRGDVARKVYKNMNKTKKRANHYNERRIYIEIKLIDSEKLTLIKET